MNIDKDQILQLLRSQGQHDQYSQKLKGQGLRRPRAKLWWPDQPDLRWIKAVVAGMWWLWVASRRSQRCACGFERLCAGS
jgi:hypothetical protein